MSANGVESSVRPLGEADIEFAAALHASALPEGFFVALGQPFLRAYYRAYRDSPHALGLVATVHGAPCGFVVGTIDGGHYGWILRHRFREHAWAALRGMLRRPGLVARFLRTRATRYGRGIIRLRSRGRTSAGPASGSVTTVGVLAHIAVADSQRGKGIGADLVAAFVSGAARHGTERLRVLTRADDGAAPFYERLGWQPTETVRDVDGVEFQVLTRGA